MSITKRLDNIALIKTLMMIAVVLGHSLVFFGGTWFTVIEPSHIEEWMKGIASWMNTFHIQAFTMASGFLFYYLKKEKNRYNNPKKDIKKRAARLLVPYIFACALWAIPVDCFFGYKSSFGELVYRYLFMADPSQMWFLIMLFLVFCFFEFFSDRIKISLKNLIIVFLITTVVSRITFLLHIDVFQIPKTLQFILYFYFGGFVYSHKNKITGKQTLIMVMIAGLLYLGSLFADSSGVDILKIAKLAVAPIISVLEIGSIYYICTRLISKKKINLKSKFYNLLEDNGFGIYIFHMQILFFAIAIFNGVVPPIVQVAITFLISLFGAVVMSWVLKKWKVTRWMFGL